ncbi:MAG TPA: response regulator [Anaerolineales bacterium]|nr:response regulator [Anaerolineales bacterium]
MTVINRSGAGGIRILLADDHHQVREQLAARLQRENGFDLVGVAANSRLTLQLALDARPRVLLIDPMMRDGMGLATLRRLVAELPDLAVVVLTAVIDTSLDMKLQELGVHHKQVKGVATADLISELRLAANG